jgi:UDP-glucose 4-epimerase
VELAGKRVVVTGGAGFIGSHVADRAVAEEAVVVVVDDLSVGSRENLRGALEAGARLVVGDVRDADLMRDELDGAAAVIHMACDNLRASLERPLHTHEVNATGTLVTALAAVDARVERFVYVSSSEAYGSAQTLPMREDHPLDPTTVYGAAKAAGELYTQACMRTYGLPAVVVRPFNAYGPREHATGASAEVIPRFATRILAGRPPVIFGDGAQTRDFTWVEETAAGIVASARSDALVGEAVNIAYGEGVSIRRIAELLLELLGATDLEPEWADERPGDVRDHAADVSKARAVLGFTATVPVREGLERYTAWLRAEQAGASWPAAPVPER